MMKWPKIFGRKDAGMTREEKPEDRARRDEMNRQIEEQLEANRATRAMLGPRVAQSMRLYETITEAMNRL